MRVYVFKTGRPIPGDSQSSRHLGPYSVDQLKRRLEEQVVGENDFVALEREHDRMPLRKYVESLAPAELKKFEEIFRKIRELNQAPRETTEQTATPVFSEPVHRTVTPVRRSTSKSVWIYASLILVAAVGSYVAGRLSASISFSKPQRVSVTPPSPLASQPAPSALPPAVTVKPHTETPAPGIAKVNPSSSASPGVTPVATSPSRPSTPPPSVATATAPPPATPSVGLPIPPPAPPSTALPIPTPVAARASGVPKDAASAKPPPRVRTTPLPPATTPNGEPPITNLIFSAVSEPTPSHSLKVISAVLPALPATKRQSFSTPVLRTEAAELLGAANSFGMSTESLFDPTVAPDGAFVDDPIAPVQESELKGVGIPLGPKEFLVPIYPRNALENREEGEVTLGITVGNQGVPIRIEIRKSSNYYVLDEAARVRAARDWVFPRTRVRHYVARVSYKLPDAWWSFGFWGTSPQRQPIVRVQVEPSDR